MVLMTGATGFLGSRVLKKLAGHRQDIICIKRSASDCTRVLELLGCVEWFDSDERKLGSLFAENRIDVIIHCATNYGRDGRDYFDTYESNLAFPLQLMNYAEKYGCRYFINTSTFFVRGIGQTDSGGDGIYMDAYVRSKDLFCAIVRRHIKESRLAFVNLQLEHVYGADDRAEKFVSYLVKSLCDNVPVIPLSMGTQRRDWIYIDDVVSAYMAVLDHLPLFMPGNFYHFEVGTGIETSLRAFAQLVKEKTHSASILGFGERPMNKNELGSSCADNAGLRELGWSPQFDIPKGIEQMIGRQQDEVHYSRHTNL